MYSSGIGLSCSFPGDVENEVRCDNTVVSAGLVQTGLCDQEASPRELSDPVGKLLERVGWTHE